MALEPSANLSDKMTEGQSSVSPFRFKARMEEGQAEETAWCYILVIGDDGGLLVVLSETTRACRMITGSAVCIITLCWLLFSSSLLISSTSLQSAVLQRS